MRAKFMAAVLAAISTCAPGLAQTVASYHATGTATAYVDFPSSTIQYRTFTLDGSCWGLGYCSASETGNILHITWSNYHYDSADIFFAFDLSGNHFADGEYSGSGYGSYTTVAYQNGNYIPTINALNFDSITITAVPPPSGLAQPKFTFAVVPLPEPASWAMLAGGFAVMGAAMRRQPGKSVHVEA